MFLKSKAIIFGISGPELLPSEKELFAFEKPLGFILFSRNIVDKNQTSRLVQHLKNSVGNPYTPIFIDQEGGRVCRLRPPGWLNPPASSFFGNIADQNFPDAKRALLISTLLIAQDLVDLGISSTTIPVLDILNSCTHNVIGDRAYSNDKHKVVELGNIVSNTLISYKVAPVIKHIPGHGRATADSHLTLPLVDTAYKDLLDIDFYPFQKLNHLKLAMTAHILYKNIDPVNPTTFSKKVISEIRNTIGFQGILMTDCILMNALSGSPVQRVQRSIGAGCDIVLYTRGTVQEMKDAISVVPYITEAQNTILVDVFGRVQTNCNLSKQNMQKELDKLLKKYSDSMCLQKHSIDPTDSC